MSGGFVATLLFFLSFISYSVGWEIQTSDLLGRCIHLNQLSYVHVGLGWCFACFDVSFSLFLGSGCLWRL